MTAIADAPKPTERRTAALILRRPWVWGLLAALLGAVVFFLLRARGPRVPTEVIVRRDLEQHLVASGRVLAPARVEITAQLAGLVRSVAVREGDHVGDGTLLVQLDDAEAKAAVALATAEVAQAASRAERVTHVDAIVATQALAQAEANHDAAQTKYDAAKRLFDADALTQQDFDEAHRALDVAKAQHDSATAELAGSGVDAREAWAGLREAQAHLVSAKVQLSRTKLLALGEGEVLVREVEPGVVTQPGRVLLVLSLAGPARLVLQPDERDLSLIQVGQKARASADAYPSERFDAEVSYLAPSIDPTRGTVEVRLRVATPPAYLRPDMTVSVDLLVAARKQVLIVRSDAVRGFATATPWTMVVASGRLERRELELGVRGDGDVEVLSGLVEGDVVVLPDGQNLVVGQRVRPFVSLTKGS